MGNRGQKRTEMIDELPADKRACSSLDFRPSSSNSSVQTHMNSSNSTHETHDNDMETSSSASASSRSEGEPERDSAYGSCDSDDAEQRHINLRHYRDYQRQRSSGDHGKFKRILTSLSEETGPSGQVAALTELCEVLSFCTEDSLSGMVSDSLSPLLVNLAKHETNPEIMLLAIRAITYICDVYPRSSNFLIRHDAVPALCQRLMAIEYSDVAEQVMQLYMTDCIISSLSWTLFYTRKYCCYMVTYRLSSLISCSVCKHWRRFHGSNRLLAYRAGQLWLSLIILTSSQQQYRQANM